MTQLSLPFSGNPSSSFGYRKIRIKGQLINHLHDGTDWACAYNTPLRAMGDGVIDFSVKESVRGWRVGVKHPDGRSSGFNLMRGRSPLPDGARVSAGQVIGYSGPHPGWEKDGAAATGPHSHAWLKDARGNFIDMRAHLIWTGFAGSNAQPFKPPTPKENDTMIVLHDSSTGHIFAVDTEYVHWLGTDKDVKLIAGVSSATDEVHRLTGEQASIVFAAYGINNFWREPKNLKAWGKGDVWSRNLEIQDQLNAALAMLSKPVESAAGK